MDVVDVHTHFVPEFVYETLQRGTCEHGLTGTAEQLDSPSGALPLGYAELRHPDAKLAAMDERGVSTSVVSLTPHLFVYDDGRDPIGFAQRANDALAGFVASSPRLHGIATVPLGAPAAAAAELRRAVVDLGLRGAIIGTGLSSDAPLDTLELDPLFQAAVELDVPLLVHPSYCGLMAEADFFLHNSLGVPFDTAWAVARLVVSGALDPYPGLRLVLPHGGGALPAVLGRLDNAWHRRDELKRHARRPPSAYLGQLWFDSVVHSPVGLRLLAEVAGADHVVLGTDSPYLTGDPAPLDSFRAARLDAEGAARTARHVFGLGDEAPAGAAARSHAPAFFPGAPATDAVRDAIVAHETRLLGPAARADAHQLEQLIHPDFDEIGRTGKYWERDEVIRVLQTVPHQTECVEFDRVIQLAPDVAHVRFRTEDARGVVHRSSIWIHEGGDWRQRYHQGTPDTQDVHP